MVSRQQVERLRKARQRGSSVELSAAISGMSVKTARKYLKEGKMPEELKASRTWRTRDDAFSEVWGKVEDLLKAEPGLEAKTIFDWLQEGQPGKFQDSQLRSLQRRIKAWRALEGPGREVFFPQIHRPGELCESDFTHMDDLRITIQGQLYSHMLYHFVLTYSNWESVDICYSENFESLSTGIQNALWKLGGVPQKHRTDRLSAAVQNLTEEREFTARYKALLGHYHLEGQKIQPRKANENGDVEQSHNRFKEAVDQSLMLRGGRDFDSLDHYQQFLTKLCNRRNSGRRERLKEELEQLSSLPARRIEAYRELLLRVSSFSTIAIKGNIYSVNSRLIKEKVNVRLYAQYVEVWYAQRCVETLPRCSGRSKYLINYRHVIDWLVRKPGAFENYRYHDAMFPSTMLRMTYDCLKTHLPQRAVKEYLEILSLAAKHSEHAVDDALKTIFAQDLVPRAKDVLEIIAAQQHQPINIEVAVANINLQDYDKLLNNAEDLA